MKKIIKQLLSALGYDIVPKRWGEVPEYKNKGFDESFFLLYEQCKPFTMTSAEKMFALYRAINYINKNQIDGAIVECGVAAGGSMMMAALTSIANRNTEREIQLYDTYAGMPKPTEKDVNYRGDIAYQQWEQSQNDGYNEWCYSSIDSVKENMARTNYPIDHLHFIKGRIEDTLEEHRPDKIALLRLDTDWYASTKCELEYLYPRLINGGVLIIDDYGHWEGCRKATDDFFNSLSGPRPLLNRIDRLGVMAIKPSSC